MLQRELYVTPQEFASTHAELEYIKTIQKIRAGALPTIRSSVILSSSELCHWESHATYHKVLNASVRLLNGRLIVTDRKVRFVSAEGGFEFGASKIVEVNFQYPGGIRLHLTRNQGNGFYALQGGETLCEILRVILKKHHRQEVYGRDGARTIPQDVKNAVWQRDGGKCIECGSEAYIEFDHIIPWSKGGASSVNNVQILCRHCNLAKADKI